LALSHVTGRSTRKVWSHEEFRLCEAADSESRPQPQTLETNGNLNVFILRTVNCVHTVTEEKKERNMSQYLLRLKKVIGEPWFTGLTLKTVLN
jgi:hypothetical protein